jgi:hypothetical protein
MASAQPVRLTRDILLVKLFLALAVERQVVSQTDVHSCERGGDRPSGIEWRSDADGSP